MPLSQTSAFFSGLNQAASQHLSGRLGEDPGEHRPREPVSQAIRAKHLQTNVNRSCRPALSVL
jgi:hypothetical protein